MMAGYMACVSARVYGILPACRLPLLLVIPAKAGIQGDSDEICGPWIPAFAGMTEGNWFHSLG